MAWGLSVIDPKAADACESLQEIRRCNPKHVTGESHPQLPERWSSAFGVEDGALITPKSCSQGCYKHWSSKHQRDRCGRCCCAGIDTGIAKNKPSHVMGAVVFIHEQWPALCLRAHTCGTRAALHFILWTDPQILAEVFGQWWGGCSVVAPCHVEHDLLCVSMGERNPNWGSKGGTQVCSVLCLVIPRGFRASYVSRTWVYHYESGDNLYLRGTLHG